MATSNLQAGGEIPDRDEERILVIGREAWSFGPSGLVLRAFGIGFALGAVFMGAVALFAR